MLSDHAFIVADIDLKIVHDQQKSVVRRRQWRKVDFDACSIREDLHRSSLLTDPPSRVAELFACYDFPMILVLREPLTLEGPIRGHF